MASINTLIVSNGLKDNCCLRRDNVSICVYPSNHHWIKTIFTHDNTSEWIKRVGVISWNRCIIHFAMSG